MIERRLLTVVGFTLVLLSFLSLQLAQLLLESIRMCNGDINLAVAVEPEDEIGGKPSTAVSAKEVEPPYSGPQRVFEPWDFEKNPFPCYPPEENWWSTKVLRHTPTRRGIFFVRNMKTGSSTVAGIAIRIARSMAEKGAMIKADSSSNYELCRTRFDHSTAVDLRYGERKKGESFLFSFVRDPTTRATSQFFHFEVSRNKVEPTDETFQDYLLDSPFLDNYYLWHMSTIPFDNHTPRDEIPQFVEKIVNDYDFIGVSERMHESLVVMKMLLGLDMNDILYLSAKKNGGFDGGGHKEQCFFIVPSYVSPGMKEFFTSEAWKERIVGDEMLHKASNRSLDLTIDYLGRDEVERQVKEYRRALQTAEEECLPNTIFPCSPGGVRHVNTMKNFGQAPCYWMGSGCDYECMWRDSGCGYECLDMQS